MTDAFWLVVNAASGGNSPAAVAEVKAALASAGQPVARVHDVAEAGLPEQPLLRAAGVTRLAIFAGDGTVNTVACALEGWDGAVLVLPGGTANLLARALHGACAAPRIASGISAFSALRRPCIRSSAGTALVELLAGPGATWSDVREELRDGAVGGIAEKAVAALRQSAAGPMVVLADPPLGRTEGYAGIRLEVSDEGLVAEGYGAQTVGDYLRQGLALLRRNFRDGPHEPLGCHRSVLCRSAESRPIPLMIDGERREGGAQERFFLAPFALDLLARPA